nr:MAG TPA: hypothetical protein [Caudoviricetes sp.]
MLTGGSSANTLNLRNLTISLCTTRARDRYNTFIEIE